jgi:hypothetical protein
MVMNETLSRRNFLQQTVLGAAGIGGLRLAPAQETARAPEHTLTVISGKPRERGRQYGANFRDGIRSFLDRELFTTYGGRPNPRENMLRYAAACGKMIQEYSPIIHEEMEGMAEGSGLRLEEIVLINSHEEMFHEGLVPAVEHCTVFGAIPPDTRDDRTFVCQTWDWMESASGLSTMLHWKRPEGPSLLTYAYPGLWAGAGLNTAGVALCWHSAKGGGNEPRVGIPAYVLVAQMLYQDTAKSALDEVRRAVRAGWFAFTLADSRGSLTLVRGTPKGLTIQNEALSTGKGGRLVAKGERRLDLDAMKEHATKVKVDATIDSMIFDCSGKEAYVARQWGNVTPWKRFSIQE